MSALRIVGFAGSTSRPSRTRLLVDRVVRATASRLTVSHQVYDLWDVLPELGSTLDPSKAPERVATVLDAIRQADALVVGSPVYKGTYTGLFKHFFDLVDPLALRGKPVLLTATGGGDRHALIVEHQLRPLFGFFEAFALPTAVYAVDRDFVDGAPVSEPILKRLDQAVSEAGRALASRAINRIAAE